VEKTTIYLSTELKTAIKRVARMGSTSTTVAGKAWRRPRKAPVAILGSQSIP